MFAAYDRIHGGRVFALGEPYVAFIRDHPRANSVDGFAINGHPKGDFAQALLLLNGQLAIRLGTDVQ